jgi:Zn-dependent protease with chaperone function
MLQDQDKINERLKRLPSDIRLIIEKRIELYLFEFGDKFSSKFAKLASKSATFFILLLGIIFLLMSLAYFLAELLGSTALGFLIVAVIIFVFSLIIYTLSPELIEHKVRKSIAMSLLDDDEDEIGNNEIPKEIVENNIDSVESTYEKK